MSKSDALRAMREARYAASQTRATVAPAKRTQTLATKPASTKPAEKVAASGEPVADGLCGHRNMSGRTCTREHGHSAKSHRYS